MSSYTEQHYSNLRDYIDKLVIKKELGGTLSSEDIKNVKEIGKIYVKRGDIERLGELISYLRENNIDIEFSREEILNTCAAFLKSHFLTLKNLKFEYLEENKISDREFYNILKSLKAFKESIRISFKGTLLEEIIQDLFEKHTSFSRFKILKDFTGIIPSKENILRVYNSYIQRELLTELVHLKKELFIPPEDQERIIQENYKKYILNGDLEKLIKLMGFTGIEISENVLQECYKTFFEDVFSSLSDNQKMQLFLKIRGLAMLTNINPSEEIFREECEKNIEKEHFSNVRYLLHLAEMLGIDKKVLEAPIQRKYCELIKEKDFSKFKWLKEETKVPPSQELLKLLEKN